MKNKTRKFSCSDSKLLEFASTVASFLPDDIADFTAFDSTFGQPTIDGLQAALTDAGATKPDNVVIDEMAELTNTVTQKMEDCREGYRTVAYFVDKVFKNKKDIQKQFGLKDFRKSRKSPARMIVFMRSLAETTIKYLEDLIAGGMNENEAILLPTLHQKLFDAKNNQEIYKKQRGKFTQERIEKLNLLFGELTPISKAARKVYADNPAQLAKYVLPGPGTKDGDE